MRVPFDSVGIAYSGDGMLAPWMLCVAFKKDKIGIDSGEFF